MVLGRRITVLIGVLLIVASLSYAFSPVLADPGNGTFAMNLGSSTVNGNLQNAIIQSNSVSLSMILNGYVQTSIGPVPITANGMWVGLRNGTLLSGDIQDVTGTVHMCILFWCGQATFVGQGQWAGTLASTEGAGTFEGTVTFISSDFSQIHLNQPAPVSGTWSAEFQLT